MYLDCFTAYNTGYYYCISMELPLSKFLLKDNENPNDDVYRLGEIISCQVCHYLTDYVP